MTAILSWSGCATDATTVDYSADVERAALAANARFYVALNAMFAGDVGPMESLWSHQDAVTYLPPTGERLHGWPAVRASWQAQAAMRLGGHVEATDVRVVALAPTLAMTVTTELGSNPGAPGGRMTVDVRSTKLFRLEKGAWKLIADHVDPLVPLSSDTR